MLQEIQMDDIKPLARWQNRQVIYFYTPMCGTCKVARKMLEVVDATMNDVIIYTCDANFAGPLLQSWRVQSIPALAYIERGELVDLQFAFHDVETLYHRLRNFLDR